jgi:hydrogenase maturation factor HypF (carbamoyltransferase family)
MLCSYCQKEYEPSQNQRFNYQHNLVKNPTCSPKCQALIRIRLEYDKKNK